MKLEDKIYTGSLHVRWNSTLICVYFRYNIPYMLLSAQHLSKQILMLMIYNILSQTLLHFS